MRAARLSFKRGTHFCLQLRGNILMALGRQEEAITDLRAALKAPGP